MTRALPPMVIERDNALTGFSMDFPPAQRVLTGTSPARSSRPYGNRILSYSRCGAACAGHIGRAPGFVDEDEAGRIEIELAFKPCLAPLQDIGTALFAGVRSLFLNVIRRRLKNRQSV